MLSRRYSPQVPPHSHDTVFLSLLHNDTNDYGASRLTRNREHGRRM